ASPIRRKLLIAVFLTSAAAWVLAAIAIAGYEQWTFHDRAEQELSQRAQLLSLNLAAALLFTHKDSATEILATLQDLPEMLSACVYDSADNLFTSFNREQRDDCPKLVGSN